METVNSRQPILNIPSVVLALVAVFAICHALRIYLFDDHASISTILRYSFIPTRYVDPELIAYSPMARLWSPVTYSFFHGDWTHLGVNSLWLLIFGTVVARRFGALTFLLFCGAGSVGGAIAHYVTNSGSVVPMIGASAVVSACVGAATRFAFRNSFTLSDDDIYRKPLSLFETMTNRQTFAFIGIWMLINFLTGIGTIDPTGEGASIAWEAHIGGFLVGLLAFGVFDPISRRTPN